MKITAPKTPYEIQQHEVTWAELQLWLDKNSQFIFPDPPRLPTEKEKRDLLPATNVPWATADAYCRSIGGSLPTEEQWEYAARGANRRQFPWGDEKIDVQETRVLAGLDAKPSPVMTSTQDRTPGKEDILYDMLGNAREWTADPFRADLTEPAYPWAYQFRVVRGLPLIAPPPDPKTSQVLDSGILYRDPVCTSKDCYSGTVTGDGLKSVVVSMVIPDKKREETESGKAFAQAFSTLPLAKILNCVDETKPVAIKEGSFNVELSITYVPSSKCCGIRCTDGTIGCNQRADLCDNKEEVYAGEGVSCKWRWVNLRAQIIIKPMSSSGNLIITQKDSTESCIKAALDSYFQDISLNQNSRPWTAKILFQIISRHPPEKLHDIGFRCVRPVMPAQ